MTPATAAVCCRIGETTAYLTAVSQTGGTVLDSRVRHGQPDTPLWTLVRDARVVRPYQA
jgi:hypothetical protein